MSNSNQLEWDNLCRVHHLAMSSFYVGSRSCNENRYNFPRVITVINYILWTWNIPSEKQGLVKIVFDINHNVPVCCCFKNRSRKVPIYCNHLQRRSCMYRLQIFKSLYVSLFLKIMRFMSSGGSCLVVMNESLWIWYFDYLG